MSIFVRQSVTTFMNNSQMARTISIIFLSMAFYQDENAWFQIWFWSEKYKGVFFRGVKEGGNLRITIILIYISAYLKSRTIFLTVIDSIGLKPKFQKRGPFLGYKGGGGGIEAGNLEVIIHFL